MAVDRPAQAGCRDAALAIYRWFPPLLDLDVSTYLVQNIRLAEALTIDSNDRSCMPCLLLAGEARAQCETIVRGAVASRLAVSTL